MITVLFLLAFTASPVVSSFQETAPFPPPPSDISHIASIVSTDEPGNRLVITGRVFHADGKTPFKDLVLYFYQTDDSGVYNKEDGSYLRPRLHGWVRTAKDGSYELRTIKPGSYPGRTEAAHIHITVKLRDTRPQWLESILFEGDPNLGKTERRQPDTMGRLSPVVRLSKDARGVLHAVRDLVMPER